MTHARAARLDRAVDERRDHILGNSNADMTLVEYGSYACPYCHAAKALLAKNPSPTREEVADALAGNLCRCTGYVKILEAVEGAAALLRGEAWEPARATLYGEPEPR